MGRWLFATFLVIMLKQHINTSFSRSIREKLKIESISAYSSRGFYSRSYRAKTIHANSPGTKRHRVKSGPTWTRNKADRRGSHRTCSVAFSTSPEHIYALVYGPFHPLNGDPNGPPRFVFNPGFSRCHGALIYQPTRGEGIQPVTRARKPNRSPD